MIINKTCYLLLLLFGITICIVSSSKNNRKQAQLQDPSQRQCKKHCPLKQRWICGFNGTNYRFFGNKCWMDIHNCAINESDVKNSAEYKHVSRKLCQKAHKEYHRNIIAKHHTVPVDTQIENKCIKCNAGYKPVCGYNGEINHMFKNKCHLKRFNCIHDDKKKFQATQLSNCPIPLPNKDSKNKEDDVVG